MFKGPRDSHLTVSEQRSWNIRREEGREAENKNIEGHRGPYLASGAIDLITGACVVASLQLAQSVLFPPAPRVGKLGNDLAPQGAARRKEEACSGANVPWCYFAVSETTCATNQEIPGLKSVARCSDAILRAHA